MIFLLSWSKCKRKLILRRWKFFHVSLIFLRFNLKISSKDLLLISTHFSFFQMLNTSVRYMRKDNLLKIKLKIIFLLHMNVPCDVDVECSQPLSQAHLISFASKESSETRLIRMRWERHKRRVGARVNNFFSQPITI